MYSSIKHLCKLYLQSDKFTDHNKMSRKTPTNDRTNCKNALCTYKAPLKLLKHHEALCDYGSQTCPVFKCVTTTALNSIRNHCLKEHSNIIRNTSSYKFHYNTFKDSYLNDTFEGLRYIHMILNISNELFQGEFSYAKATGLMRWGVNYLDKRRNIKFHFILTFDNLDNYIENCMPFYKDDFGDSIGCQISFDKMISYCNKNGDLTFNIEIREGEKSRNVQVGTNALVKERPRVKPDEEMLSSLSSIELTASDARYRRTKTIGAYTAHITSLENIKTVPSSSEFQIPRSNSVCLKGSISQSNIVSNKKNKRNKK